MIGNEHDYEKILDDVDDFITLFRDIPEENIAVVWSGRPFPVQVHVIRQNGRATVREMDYVLTVK